MTPPKVKYPYVGGVSWALFRFMDIADTGDRSRVYLRRLIIFKTPWCGLYLHWIYLPDNGRDPHNHPMNFISLVLKGGYTEQRYWQWDVDGAEGTMTHMRKRKRWSIARTTTRDFHDIRKLALSPTITLLFTGKRQQDWGFLTKDGFVPQTEYREAIARYGRYGKES